MSLLQNAVLFARLLRVGGLDAGPDQLSDWLRALTHVDLRSKQQVKSAASALLVSRREDLDWFDAAFELFWQARDPRELEGLELGLLVQRQVERRRQAALTGLQASTPPPGQDSRDDQDEQRVAAWSDREQLRHKDFAELDAEELEQVRRMMRRMRWDLETRRSRRLTAARRGEVLDLRRSLRRNLAHGGELIELKRRRRKRRRRPLVLLCDVSGSMEAYSRLLLEFVYAISHSRFLRRSQARVEAFAFGTRLTRLTAELRGSNVDDALRAATRRVEDWGGGTRTGEALHTFNREWARRVLSGGAVVLLISDGWDRGDIDLLGREIALLHRLSHRLVWLNPLLGSPTYEPLTRGMQAALPHVDDFLPVHDLHSLEQLGKLLERLTDRGVRSSAAVASRATA
ncbi:MAG: VWA domain-containing protein [Acidobacteria bacterium]|nr:MAG: VWA domain-containing protein [Acidobacteriota bacterium]REK06245.1 MAG: VWA domain-containing protein [Acidobacteriota bacterium]